MTWVPPGEFELKRLRPVTVPAGEDSSALAPLDSVKTVVPFAGFWMDTHEVTVGKYREFARATGREVPRQPPWSQSDDYPVVVITWDDADAYCKWRGARLPTETEWEYAARGGLKDQTYAWGDSLDHDLGNFQGTGGRDTWESAAPVGSFPPNGFGLHDMTGNVWEWGADMFTNAGGRHGDAVPTPGGLLRAVRGGSWGNGSPTLLHISKRFYYRPFYRNAYFGCRCVRDP